MYFHANGNELHDTLISSDYNFFKGLSVTIPLQQTKNQEQTAITTFLIKHFLPFIFSV